MNKSIRHSAKPPEFGKNSVIDWQQFSVETEEDDETVSFLDKLGKEVKNPSWLVSLAYHLLLLIIFAMLVIPSVEDKTIALFSETVEHEALTEFHLEATELNVPDFEPETHELVSEELEEAMEVPEVVLFEEVEEEVDTTSSELLPVPVQDAYELGAGKMSAEAEGIQAKVAKAGGKAGEVQFSLDWETESDLDIHVITPFGERIWHRSRDSSCLGLLDVDANAFERNLKRDPVENVRWLKGKPKTGRYTIVIHMFKDRERTRERTVEYQLMAKTGDNVTVDKKVISLNDNLHIYRFIYFAPSLSLNDREELHKKLKKTQATEEVAAKKMLGSIADHGRDAERQLGRLVMTYPHTDAAIEALKRMRASGK